MAVVRLLDSDDAVDLNILLEAALEGRMAWQMDYAEFESRLDDAAWAIIEIMNRPYYEGDLTDAEREQAEAAYAAAKAKL